MKIQQKKTAGGSVRDRYLELDLAQGCPEQIYQIMSFLTRGSFFIDKKHMFITF